MLRYICLCNQAIQKFRFVRLAVAHLFHRCVLVFACLSCTVAFCVRSCSQFSIKPDNERTTACFILQVMGPGRELFDGSLGRSFCCLVVRTSSVAK